MRINMENKIKPVWLRKSAESSIFSEFNRFAPVQLHVRFDIGIEPKYPPVHGRAGSTGQSEPVFKTMFSTQISLTIVRHFSKTFFLWVMLRDGKKIHTHGYPQIKSVTDTEWIFNGYPWIK